MADVDAPQPAHYSEATGPISGSWTHRFVGGPLDGSGMTIGDDAPQETTGPEGVVYALGADGKTYRPKKA